MPISKKFSKRNSRKNSKRMRSRRSKRVGNCSRVHDMSYKPPCQGPQVLLRGGGELDPGVQYTEPVHPRGCESYQIDVNQSRVGGQPIVSGNPSGCLDNQMHNVSRGENVQLGGGAACSGVGFDLSDQIGGLARVVPHHPNCVYSDVSHFAGGARRGKGSGRGRGKRNNKQNKSLRKAIEKYCKKKRKACSKNFKKRLYNKVQRNLCN
jgi:hypothetical protein